MGHSKGFIQLLCKMKWDLLQSSGQRVTRSGSCFKIIALAADVRSDFETGKPIGGYHGNPGER